jgi:hypothetical protein
VVPAARTSAALARLMIQLCGGCMGTLAYAQDEAPDGDNTTLSGSARLSYFSSSRDLNGLDDVAVGSAQIELTHSLSEDQRFEVETRILAEDLTREGHTRAHWISAYGFIRWAHVDLRFGQQKIRWGKADGINPTDFFTPIDYTIALPLEDDRYLSVPAVRADVHVSDTDSVSAVIEPDFTPSRVPWPKPTPVAVRDDEPSGRAHPQLGLRWLHTGERLDWSVSAFRGFATLPLLDFDGIAADGSATYVRHYAAIDAIGADVARNFGKVGFRAELAYTKPRSGKEDGRQAAQSSYFLVAGIDRSFDEWNLNVQALLRHTPDYEKTVSFNNAQEQWAAIQNGIVQGQQERFMYGMTARLVADWRHDTLQTELLMVTNFSPTNAFIRPLLTYAVSDQRKIRFGAEYYSGRALSYFGSLKRNRTVFVEFQQFY